MAWATARRTASDGRILRRLARVRIARFSAGVTRRPNVMDLAAIGRMEKRIVGGFMGDSFRKTDDMRGVARLSSGKLRVAEARNVDLPDVVQVARGGVKVNLGSGDAGMAEQQLEIAD